MLCRKIPAIVKSHLEMRRKLERIEEWVFGIFAMVIAIGLILLMKF